VEKSKGIREEKCGKRVDNFGEQMFINET